LFYKGSEVVGQRNVEMNLDLASFCLGIFVAFFPLSIIHGIVFAFAFAKNFGRGFRIGYESGKRGEVQQKYMDC
jgi:hypothetical protein